VLWIFRTIQAFRGGQSSIERVSRQGQGVRRARAERGHDPFIKKQLLDLAQQWRALAAHREKTDAEEARGH
jgi:hypothetical protein